MSVKLAVEYTTSLRGKETHPGSAYLAKGRVAAIGIAKSQIGLVRVTQPGGRARPNFSN